MVAFGQRSKIDQFRPHKLHSVPHLDAFHLIGTKFDVDILFDPRNMRVEDFFIFLKFQDGRRRSKFDFRQNFGSKITFWLGKWIPFIRFGQNLAGSSEVRTTGPWKQAY